MSHLELLGSDILNSVLCMLDADNKQGDSSVSNLTPASHASAILVWSDCRQSRACVTSKKLCTRLMMLHIHCSMRFSCWAMIMSKNCLFLMNVSIHFSWLFHLVAPISWGFATPWEECPLFTKQNCGTVVVKENICYLGWGQVIAKEIQ